MLRKMKPKDQTDVLEVLEGFSTMSFIMVSVLPLLRV